MMLWSRLAFERRVVIGQYKVDPPFVLATAVLEGIQLNHFTFWPKLLLLLVILLNDPSSSASGSNGQALFQSFDVITHRAMGKATLLQILGLKSLPRPVGRSKIPPFMHSVFRKQTVGGSKVDNDTIRSFYPHDHHACDCAPSSCVCMLFNISAIPDTEQVRAAKLRILVDGGATPQQPPANLTVEIHQIQHHGAEIKYRLMDTQIISTSNTSWMIFNVKPAVKKWKRGSRYNHGLQVKVVSSSPFRSATQHVRLKRREDQTEDQWLKERPLLVTFTNDGRGGRRGRRRRTMKEARGERYKDRPRVITRTTISSHCRRHRMYIDFSELGWSDWVAAPYGYNAYYCGGECSYPLASHQSPTNHSILQTLVKSINPRAASNVCCVPTKLSAITMLVRDGQNHVVLKKLENMVVEECGCR
ncbi:bone morphogenetic protein 4-like [Pomacea canaliculata]|uniref:bone morphogenetic protein 4-like n=1 Tax=Pomacea canaliculata TaxID=400727 RepID=UPI000D738FB3|nr:bone morphogenetic protein 4-like [Pomacea canaliculata]